MYKYTIMKKTSLLLPVIAAISLMLLSSCNENIEVDGGEKHITISVGNSPSTKLSYNGSDDGINHYLKWDTNDGIHVTEVGGDAKNQFAYFGQEAILADNTRASFSGRLTDPQNTSTYLLTYPVRKNDKNIFSYTDTGSSIDVTVDISDYYFPQTFTPGTFIGLPTLGVYEGELGTEEIAVASLMNVLKITLKPSPDWFNTPASNNASYPTISRILVSFDDPLPSSFTISFENFSEWYVGHFILSDFSFGTRKDLVSIVQPQHIGWTPTSDDDEMDFYIAVPSAQFYDFLDSPSKKFTLSILDKNYKLLQLEVFNDEHTNLLQSTTALQGNFEHLTGKFRTLYDLRTLEFKTVLP